MSELSCHPARAGSILDEVYGAERAGELKTLTETRVNETLRDAARARRQHRAPGLGLPEAECRAADPRFALADEA